MASPSVVQAFVDAKMERADTSTALYVCRAFGNLQRMALLLLQFLMLVAHFTIDNCGTHSYIVPEAYVDYGALQLAVLVAGTAIPFGQLLASRPQCA